MKSANTAFTVLVYALYPYSTRVDEMLIDEADANAKTGTTVCSKSYTVSLNNYHTIISI